MPDHFSMLAGLYNRLADYQPSSKFLDLLALAPESLVLDAGGGTGRVAAALRGQAKVVCVADPSIAMLRHARRKGLTCVCTPCESLPFRSSSFGSAIMMDALHHVVDQGMVVGELGRVLAPGGVLMIVEPDIHRNSVKLLAAVEKMLLMRSHFLDDNGISALFGKELSRVRETQVGSDLWLWAEKTIPD